MKNINRIKGLVAVCGIAFMASLSAFAQYQDPNTFYNPGVPILSTGTNQIAGATTNFVAFGYNGATLTNSPIAHWFSGNASKAGLMARWQFNIASGTTNWIYFDIRRGLAGSPNTNFETTASAAYSFWSQGNGTTPVCSMVSTNNGGNGVPCDLYLYGIWNTNTISAAITNLVLWASSPNN